MHDQAAQRRAALAGGAHGGKGDAAQREREVGARRDDRAVVAAELEDRAGEAARQALADHAAHRRRSGCRHHRHAAIVDELLADLAAADQHAVQALRRVSEPLDRARQQGVDRKRRQRRPVRRLPDHGVAAHQRQRRVPGPDRDRKVEGRDHADRADRMPLLHQPVLGALADRREAVELAREAEREVADVDHLLDLALALGEDLAGLERDEAAELALGAAQLLAEQADQLAAARRRHGTPLRERGLRGADRPLGLLAGGRCDPGDLLAGDRRAHAKPAIRRERALAAEGAQQRLRFRADAWRCEVSCHGQPFAAIEVGAERRIIPSVAPAPPQQAWSAAGHAGLAAILNLPYHRVQQTPRQGAASNRRHPCGRKV